MLVRKGMPVAYSVYHMQRREDLYGPDAASFRPERWEGNELSEIKWAYVPFNGGPRMCLGSRLHKRHSTMVQADIRALEDFGLMLASYGIARVIQEFPDIKLPPGEPWEDLGTERQHLTIVLSNADGCKVLLD